MANDLSLARTGDPAAFQRLVTPHLKGLYGFLARRCGQLAEDVYQETLLGAWQTIGGFREGSSLKTWLYAIAGYKCTDALRKHLKQPQLVTLDELPGDGGFEGASVKRLDLKDALSALAPEDQALLHLLYTQGFSQKEAGDILGIPEGTVKSRLYYLRRSLKEVLDHEVGS